MQERLSDFIISVALFVVAAFWLWRHVKGRGPARASADGESAEEISARSGFPVAPDVFQAFAI